MFLAVQHVTTRPVRTRKHGEACHEPILTKIQRSAILWGGVELEFDVFSDFGQGNDTYLSDPELMGKYLQGTGDADGVITSESGPLGKCDDGYFWLSPSCRGNSSGCVLYFTADRGWGILHAMYRFTTFNMPFAIGVLKLEKYPETPRRLSSLFYWWTPDPTFVDLDPAYIIFPPHSAEEYRSGNYGSDSVDVKLAAWHL